MRTDPTTRIETAVPVAVRPILLMTLCLSVLFLAGCDSFVEEKPLDFVESENFFEDEDDARSVVLQLNNNLQNRGAYNCAIQRATIYQSPLLFGRSPWDNFSWTANGILDDTRTFQIYVSCDIGAYWINAYQGILRANNILRNVPDLSDSQISQSARQRFLGEARFHRALQYFNMVRFFGDVPLRTEENYTLPPAEAAELEPTAVSSIYADLIIPDLQFAVENLPAQSSSSARATQGAARTLLGKVYLRLGSVVRTGAFSDRSYAQDAQTYYQQAADVLGALVEAGNWSLEESYRDVFAPTRQAGNSETMIAAQFVAGQLSGTYAPSVQPPSDDAQIFRPWYDAMPNTYRKQFSTTTALVEEGDTVQVFSPPRMNKFREFDGDIGSVNFPILRYADALLMYAEALNEANDGPTAAAFDAINQVRARARGDLTEDSAEEGTDPEELPDLEAPMNEDDFRQAVYQEREWELFGEAHQWFDLVRTNRLFEVNQNSDYCVERCRNVQQPKHKLYPIPAVVIDQNPTLEEFQNPGY